MFRPLPLSLSFLALAAVTASAAEDGFEDNDTKATAATLTASQPSLYCADEDWFRVPASIGAGTLVVTMSHPAGTSGDLNLELWDGTQVRATAFASDAPETITWHTDGTQDWYLRIYQVNPNPNTYSLTLARSATTVAEGVDDDAFASAVSLAVNASQSDTAHDQDWRSVGTTSGHAFTATIAYPIASGNLDLEVYNASGTLITRNTLAANGAATGTGRSVTFTPSPGQTYSFAVIPFSGSSYVGTGIAYTFSTSQTVVAEDASEDNDTLATATAATLPATINAACKDDDWFALGTVGPGLVRVALSHPAGVSGDLNVVLYNAAGQAVASSFASDADEEIVYHVSAATALWARVFKAAGGDNTYTLSLGVERTSAGDDAAEPDDRFASAVTVALNTAIPRTSRDEDWFAITAANGYPLTVSLDHVIASGNLDIEVYDASATLITRNTQAANGAATGTGRSVTFTPSPGAAYRVAVIPFSGSSYVGTGVSYEFKASQAVITEDASEDNDTLATATAVTLPATVAASCKDDDWFALGTVGPGLVRAALTHPTGVSGDLSVVLYDASGNAVASDIRSDADEEVVYHAVAAAPLWVKVSKAAGGDNTYSLSLGVERTSAGDDASEPDDRAASAVSIALNATVNRTACDEDWFQVVSANGAPLTITAAWSLAAGDLDLEVYDTTGTQVTRNTVATNGAATGTGRSLVFNPETGATYRIAVVPLVGGKRIASGFAYTLATSQTAVAEDAYEQNDTLATAAALTLPASVSAACMDDDWYALGTLEPGLVAVKLTHPYGVGGDLNVGIYDSTGGIVAVSDNQDAAEQILYQVIVPDSYFVRVFKVNPGDNSYQLEVTRTLSVAGDDAAENDDVISTAVSIAPNQTVSGRVASDVDFFKVTALTGSLSVYLDYSTSAGNIDLEIYEAVGSSWKRAAQSTLAKGDATIATGRYAGVETDKTAEFRIAVIGKQGIPYTLRTEQPTVWVKQFDYGPISASSIVLYDVDGDGKDEILVGTNKALDKANGNGELLPAALLCLKADGSLLWARSFPASPDPDWLTGKVYNTTSVNSRAAVGDIDGDGRLDIVIGVGGDVLNELDDINMVGQPGDLGGVYALNASDGSIKWFRQSLDVVGGTTNVGDGRPDGVYSNPVIWDLDRNGTQEIIYGSWDQRVYVLNGSDGSLWSSGWPRHIYDTVWSSPTIADIDRDGKFDILIGGDITGNADSGTTTGGVFHVFQQDGNQLVPGFDRFVAYPSVPNLRGKFEDNPIWSSPEVADLDGDGKPEIFYGIGTHGSEASDLAKGRYVRVWNSDGTLRFKLAAEGRVFATPLIADLDGDGTKEIVAVTEDGYAQCWGSDGVERWKTRTYPFGGVGEAHPIYSAPLGVDLDGDNRLEILYAQGTNIVVVSSTGVQLTDPLRRQLNVHYYRGSPAVGDIDGDGTLDIIGAGTDQDKKKGVHAVVYRWLWDEDNAQGGNYRYGRRQFRETVNVRATAFVQRFYQQCLGRSADAVGLAYWVSALQTGIKSGADVARGFALSGEFTNRGLSDSAFVDTMYRAFFAREPDAGGKSDWLNRMATQGYSRAMVIEGFVGAQEFINLSRSYSMPGKNDRYETSRQQVQDFVERFYNHVLNRAPDLPGLAGWVEDITSGRKGGADVGRGFVLSPEMTNRNLSDSAFVDTLYQAFFNRAADAGGKSGWLAQLTAGTSRSDVLAGFTGSQEFLNLMGNYGVGAESPIDQARKGVVGELVTWLYEHALGRAPSASELSQQVDALIAGTTTADVLAASLFSSAEFQALGRSDDQFITAMYWTLFGRPAENAAYPARRSELSAGTTRAQMVAIFARETEFRNIVASYGLLLPSSG